LHAPLRSAGRYVQIEQWSKFPTLLRLARLRRDVNGLAFYREVRLTSFSSAAEERGADKVTHHFDKATYAYGKAEIAYA